MAKLKFTPNPTFELLVSVPIAGQLENEEITFTVKYLPKKQMDETDGDPNELFDNYLNRFIRHMAVGWDMDKEFNPQNLDKLLDNYPQILLRFKEKYFQEYWGVAEKN